MSAHHCGAAGLWQTNYGGLAYSDDGVDWSRAATATCKWRRWRGQAGTPISTALPNGSFGCVMPARVPEADLLEMERYEYCNGGDWMPGDSSTCAPILAGPIGEMSVAYSPYFSRWLMTHIEGVGSDIILRDAPTPPRLGRTGVS